MATKPRSSRCQREPSRAVGGFSDRTLAIASSEASFGTRDGQCGGSSVTVGAAQNCDAGRRTERRRRGPDARRPRRLALTARLDATLATTVAPIGLSTSSELSRPRPRAVRTALRGWPRTTPDTVRYLDAVVRHRVANERVLRIGARRTLRGCRLQGYPAHRVNRCSGRCRSVSSILAVGVLAQAGSASMMLSGHSVAMTRSSRNPVFAKRSRNCASVRSADPL